MIETRQQLITQLHKAMQLEHATIPVYLTALYSLRFGQNTDAVHVLRVAAVEEMLHLTLAANLLSSITGDDPAGRPNLGAPNFVPSYPAFLPSGEIDFQVHLERFSAAAVDMFLQIERSAQAPKTKRLSGRRAAAPARSRLASPLDEKDHYYSIGEFYADIQQGFELLHKQLGDKLFNGNPAHQISPEYYYSAGGQIVVVKDFESATEAIRLIIEQGEGYGGGIYDHGGELSHLHRFEQLKLGKYYQKGDKPGEPSGPSLAVDWEAVYPIRRDAKIDDYADHRELRVAVDGFNQAYKGFLGLLTRAYNGEPALLLEAVPRMFSLRDAVNQIIRNPLTDSENAAPTFE